MDMDVGVVVAVDVGTVEVAVVVVVDVAVDTVHHVPKYEPESIPLLHTRTSLRHALFDALYATTELP